MSLINNPNNEEFTLFHFDNEEGETCFAVANLDLIEFEEREKFPFLLWIEIFYNETDDNNRSTVQESEELEDVMATIFKKLGKTCQYVYAAHTTIPKLRELIIYVDDEEKANIAINRLKHDFTKRTVTFDIEEDPEWEGVRGFLEEDDDDEELA